jgi:hypothetical protein
MTIASFSGASWGGAGYAPHGGHLEGGGRYNQCHAPSVIQCSPQTTGFYGSDSTAHHPHTGTAINNTTQPRINLPGNDTLSLTLDLQ